MPGLRKPLRIAPEQAVRIAVQGMFAKADSKLADKLRRQDRLAEAKVAERRIERRRSLVKEGT